MGEGTDPHHRLVADHDRRRRAKRLFRGDDVDGFDEPVAFAGIDELAGGIVPSRRLGEFGHFGEIRLPVERRVDRRTDQPGAGKAGENRAGEPAQRDATAIMRRMLPAIRFDRRVDAEIDQAEGPARAPLRGRRAKSRVCIRDRYHSLCPSVDATSGGVLPVPWGECPTPSTRVGADGFGSRHVSPKASGCPKLRVDEAKPARSTGNVAQIRHSLRLLCKSACRLETAAERADFHVAVPENSGQPGERELFRTFCKSVLTVRPGSNYIPLHRRRRRLVRLTRHRSSRASRVNWPPGLAVREIPVLPLKGESPRLK